VFEPCDVRRALRLAAKLTRDIGRGSQCKGIGVIPREGIMQRNKYNNESVKINMPQTVPSESWCAGMQHPSPLGKDQFCP
jgi:hypothetical protein